MLTDGRHNASMLTGVPPPTSARLSPAPRSRPASRGASVADGLGRTPTRELGAAIRRLSLGSTASDRESIDEPAPSPTPLPLPPAVRPVPGAGVGDEATAQVTPRRGPGLHRTLSAGGVEDDGHQLVHQSSPPRSARRAAHQAKSPKENGTSLFGPEPGGVAPGRAVGDVSLPVPERPVQAALQALFQMATVDTDERPRTAPAQAQVASHHARTTAWRPRGMVESQSDIGMGSPRSAFTSVSAGSLRAQATSRPRSGLRVWRL